MLLDHGASLISCPKVILADCVESILEGVPALLSRYLAAGAEPNLPDANGCTLLHIAAAEKSLLAVKMLVQAGANVLAEDRFGQTPIVYAEKVKANNVVQFLHPAVTKALTTSRAKNAPPITIANMDDEDEIREVEDRLPFESPFKIGGLERSPQPPPPQPLALDASINQSPRRGAVLSERLGSMSDSSARTSGARVAPIDATPMVSVLPKKIASDKPQSNLKRANASSVELNIGAAELHQEETERESEGEMIRQFALEGISQRLDGPSSPHP